MAVTATAVSLNLTLNSSWAVPPFNMSAVSATVTLNNNGTSQTTTFGNWSKETVPAVQAGGAPLTIAITDINQAANSSQIGNWALTFLPRGTNTNASPVSNNQNTVTGNGGALSGNVFTLTLPSGDQKITNTGDWDWCLVVQMLLSGGVTKTFASDPEMEVD